MIVFSPPPLYYILFFIIVLLYDKPSAPVSQPWNMFGGHLLGSIIGVCVRLGGQAASVENWVLAPISVATTVFLMDLFRCTHPPGAGTAMIAVMGGPAIWALGFGYVLTNIGSSIIFIAWACIGNNLSPKRHYPQYWIPVDFPEDREIRTESAK